MLSATGKSVQILRDHNHYVQGVAWDVFDQFIASQSCDRTCRLYGHQKNKPMYEGAILRMQLQ